MMPLLVRPFDPTLMGELENLAMRGSTDGFFEGYESTGIAELPSGRIQSYEIPVRCGHHAIPYRVR